jgi:hypothetical protein
MELVLTHVNSKLPDYIWYNFKNLRIWNPDVKITIVCHDQYQDDKVREGLRLFNVDMAPCEELMDDMWQEFLGISWYDVWGTPDTAYPSPPKFVQGTSERLYALGAYLKATNAEHTFHIENDVMVYENLQKLLPICKSCYNKIAITPMADKDHTFAFVYIPHFYTLGDFLRYNTLMMKKGNDTLVQQYNLDMVHEMSIVKLYKDQYDAVDFFPILPSGLYSNNYDKFQAIFDPASWGQYIGGTNGKGVTIGYAGNHHIIGREILAGRYTAMWNGQYPIVNNKVKLNCLHVHCKRLERFVTND